MKPLTFRIKLDALDLSVFAGTFYLLGMLFGGKG